MTLIVVSDFVGTIRNKRRLARNGDLLPVHAEDHEVQLDITTVAIASSLKDAVEELT